MPPSRQEPGQPGSSDTSDGEDASVVGCVLTPCYHCGLPADSVDHVWPRTVLGRLDVAPELERVIQRAPQRTVPACRECNCLLGPGWYGNGSLAARKRALKDKLRRRYAALLRTADWTEGELVQFGPNLREYIETSVRGREILEARLAW
jgi:hypothetical protein